MEKRFLVVTYSDDIGSDDRMDFTRISTAAKDAEAYRGIEEYAAVYDKKSRTAYVIFGDINTRVFADNVTVMPF